MTKLQLRSNLMLLLTALIWGCAFVAQSVGMDYVGPFTFNCVRFVIGAVVLLPCIVFLDKINGRTPSVWGTRDVQQRKTLLLGGLACGTTLAVASGLQQVGIMYTTVGKAGFITALYIVMVPLLGLVVHKRVGLPVWAAVALAVVGMYLLCITDGFSIGLGDTIMLLCAVVFALQILAVDYFSARTDGVRLSCLQFLVCGVWNAIPMFATETPRMADIFSAWLPILYAGVLSCGVAYTLQVIAQRNTAPAVASLLMSLESVFAVLAGWILLGEQLSARELLGCALVFGAILLAQLPSKKKEPA